MYLKLRNTKWIQKIAPSNNLPTVPCPWILTHYCQLFFKLPFIIVIHSNICHKLQSNIFITNGHPKVPELCFLKARHHCLQRLCLINIFVCSSIKIMFKWWICKWDSFRIDQKIIYLQGIHWLLSALHLCSKIWQFHQSSFLLYLYLSTDKEVLWASLT